MHVSSVRVFVAWTVSQILLAASHKDASDVSSQQTGSDIEVQLRDIVFVVLSQPNAYHRNRAKVFQEHFKQQLLDTDKADRPLVFITHKKWPQIIGTWTIFPLLPLLTDTMKDRSWIFFCEEETRVDLKKMVRVLRKYNYKEDWYLGKPLRDKAPSVIHHYAHNMDPESFAYPDWSAGFFFSRPLLVSLGDHWPDPDFRADFSIDPKYEVAMYAEKYNVTLTPVDDLCTGEQREACATWYPLKFPDCGTAVPDDELYVGVKTCKQYHENRASFVKKTWGRDATHLEYYSDVADDTIPTVNLGIPNTERGHCGKTMAMIQRFISDPDISQKSWFLIADDDTIINLKRLRKLLACYNPKDPIHMGEKYGYSVTKNNHGYPYITGGGGMVFSKEALKRLVNEKMAVCPSDDAPDDMILGKAYKNMKIPLVHSPYFHQATPDEYCQEFLRPKTAVSFHKHTNLNPESVYQDLMKEESEEVEDSGHEEL